VPLDRNAEGRIGILDGLDEPVRDGLGGDEEALAHGPASLVMKRVHLERSGADDVREAGARGDIDGVPGPIAQRFLHVRDGGIGLAHEILIDVPAERDVQDLNAAADTKHREVALPGGPGQFDLEEIPPLVHKIDTWVRLLAEKLGLGIVAAAEQQTVAKLHILRGPRRILRRRQDDRQRARRLQDLGVGAQERLGLTQRFGALQMEGAGRDSDDRPFSVGDHGQSIGGNPDMRTIKANAATRIDLAGGTVDIWPVCHLLEEPAHTVNAAVNLRAHVEVTETDDGLVTIDPGFDEVVTYPVGALEHDRYGLVTRLVEHFGAHEGLSIRLKTEAPPQSGLGGSSALSVALGGALAQLRGGLPSATVFIRLLQNVETRLLGTSTGYQDYVPAVGGGVHTIVARPEDLELHHEEGAVDFLEDKLHLIDTAIPHHSGMNNWQAVRAFLDGDADVIARFNGINTAAIAMRDAVRARDLDAVAVALDEEWGHRRKLSPVVSNEKIERIVAAVKGAGATAAKVCGAGGGGCLVAIGGDSEAVYAAAESAGGSRIEFRLDRRALEIEVA